MGSTAMTENQSDSPPTHRPEPGRPRLLDLGSLAVLVASTLVSFAGYGLLPGQMRIHWSFGGPYYGPEFAPTTLILMLFPATVAVGALAGRWGLGHLESLDEVDGVRQYGSLTLVATLALLVLVQTGLVAANL